MAAGGVDSGGFVGSTFDTSHHQNNVHSSRVIAGSGETYNGSSRLNTNTDTDTNKYGLIPFVLFFLVWCGACVAMSVFLVLNAPPFLAIVPLALPVFMCIVFVSVFRCIRQNQNALRNQARNEGINVNINPHSPSHSAHPPQTSNVPLGFQDQSLHFATNYGFHATNHHQTYGNPSSVNLYPTQTPINKGMQYSTESAGQTSQSSNVSTSMASDLPPSYEEVTKGKQTEGKFEGRL